MGLSQSKERRTLGKKRREAETGLESTIPRPLLFPSPFLCVGAGGSFSLSLPSSFYALADEELETASQLRKCSPERGEREEELRGGVGKKKGREKKGEKRAHAISILFHLLKAERMQKRKKRKKRKICDLQMNGKRKFAHFS